MSDFISFKDYIRSLGVRELPNRQMKTGVAGAVLEFFGTHVLMWVFACVCALFLLAMTSQTIAASNPPPASLTVEWRDSCEENALAPYFTLNVSATGEVTFKGISAVKEIGERYKTISPLLARPLIRTARKILEGDPAKRLQYAAPMLPEPSSHTDCLHLEIAGMGQPSSKGLV